MGYFELVNDVAESDIEFPVHASLAKELGEIYTSILEGEPMVHQLKMLKQQHPDVPQVLNMLSVAYVGKEDYERAYKINQELYQLFPDYIFARINMAQEYLNKDELEKAAGILDPALTIDTIFPQRRKIHYGEFTGFQRIRALYYTKAEMAEAFLEVVTETEDLLDDEIVLLQFRSQVMEMIDTYDLEEYDIISDYVSSVHDELDLLLGASDDNNSSFISFEYDESVQTDEPPEFIHADEIDALYNYDFDIPAEAMESLLSLPEKTLAEDLCEVLNDAVRRYEYYADDDDESTPFTFPWHAMNLLRTIQAEQAVSTMLNFMQQGEELTEFYMGDLNTEVLWQVFYPFCLSNKQELVSFLKLPNLYAYCKLPVMHAFTQLALHQPEYRSTVSGIFAELLSFFFEKKDDNNFLDPLYMSLLCEEIMDGSFAELKLLVKAVYDNQLEDGMYQDFKAWEEEYNFIKNEDSSLKGLLDWRELNAQLERQFGS